MENVDNKKCVVLGVTGSIAAYKAAELASRLVKRDVDVRVILTKAAQEFISELTFETLTKNPVATAMFGRHADFEVEHISLAKRADVFVVAPATASFIGKYANGIANDMLSTTAMAVTAPVIIAPAMNSAMYLSPANTANMEVLKSRGVMFVEPDVGLLACGDVGVGRFAAPEVLVEKIMGILHPAQQDWAGLRLLVTAGPTREPLDPVRYISNRSSGRMGYAVAQAALQRGAQVTLISGPTALTPPKGVQLVKVETAQQMYQAALDCFDRCDVCVKAAAPADFAPENFVDFKIKKADSEILPLELVKTKDILGALSRKKGDRFLCGFAAETENVEGYATGKLKKKHLDMIVANDVTAPGAGFDVTTNIVAMYFDDGSKRVLPLMEKSEVAHEILSEILKRRK